MNDEAATAAAEAEAQNASAAAAPADGNGSGDATAAAAAVAPASPPKAAPTAVAPKDDMRIYGVFTELELAVGSAADRKVSIEKLAALAPTEGDRAGLLVVLVRVGKVAGPQPKAALKNLGQVRELDGDYSVIADNSINRFENVKTERKVNVSIG